MKREEDVWSPQHTRTTLYRREGNFKKDARSLPRTKMPKERPHKKKKGLEKREETQWQCLNKICKNLEKGLKSNMLNLIFLIFNIIF